MIYISGNSRSKEIWIYDMHWITRPEPAYRIVITFCKTVFRKGEYQPVDIQRVILRWILDYHCQEYIGTGRTLEIASSKPIDITKIWKLRDTLNAILKKNRVKSTEQFNISIHAAPEPTEWVYR